MTQRQLPFDPIESREARLQRVLSGELRKHVSTAAKFFDERAAREAEAIAAGGGRKKTAGPSGQSRR